jgi:hypothetical protein
MILILNYLIMVEQPADNFNDSVFRVIYQFYKFFCIRIFFTQDTFYIFKNNIEFVLAQFQFIPFTANIADSAPV